MTIIEEKSDIKSLIVFGGGVKSDTWCQIIADITGIAVKVSESPETASRGAAILAGLGCGVISELSDTDELLSCSRTYQPDAK